MLLRASFLATATAVILAASQAAEAKPLKRAVTPVFTPPDQFTMAPIDMPLSGAFLTSSELVCPKTGKVRTMYYFNGRFPDRPDFFYIVRR